MKIVFVNPPCSNLVTKDIAPPLWALTLGAFCINEAEARLIDFNLRVASGAIPSDHTFYAAAIDEILRESPGVVCFSSMGINSHVALQLGQLLKNSDPKIVTVYGGSHFASIARSILNRCWWIDYIALGEAEVAFAELVRSLRHVDPASRVPIGGMLSRNTDLKAAISSHRRLRSDQIPSPAYELVHLPDYFMVNQTRTLDFGGNRGCVFACKYCYAPTHWGIGERRKSDERFLAELHHHASLGGRRLFFVQDNFVNSPRATAELCDKIAEARLPLTFHCYATLAQLTPDVIEALGRAGCREIFVGVDVVNEQSQATLNKRHFRTTHDMTARFERCCEHQIHPTAAFLIDVDDDDYHAIDQTIRVAMEARASGAAVRFNTLTHYPGTPLHESYATDCVPAEEKIRLAFDLPEVVIQNKLATQWPELFPFHSTHRPPQVEIELQRFAHVLATLTRSFPDTLRSMSANQSASSVIREVVRELDWDAMKSLPDWARRQEELKGFQQRMCTQASSQHTTCFFEENLIRKLSSIPSHNSRLSGTKRSRLRPFLVGPSSQPAVKLIAVVLENGYRIVSVDHSVADAVEQLVHNSSETVHNPDAWQIAKAIGITA